MFGVARTKVQHRAFSLLQPSRARHGRPLLVVAGGSGEGNIHTHHSILNFYSFDLVYIVD